MKKFHIQVYMETALKNVFVSLERASQEEQNSAKLLICQCTNLQTQQTYSFAVVHQANTQARYKIDGVNDSTLASVYIVVLVCVCRSRTLILKCLCSGAVCLGAPYCGCSSASLHSSSSTGTGRCVVGHSSTAVEASFYCVD